MRYDANNTIHYTAKWFKLCKSEEKHILWNLYLKAFSCKRDKIRARQISRNVYYHQGAGTNRKIYSRTLIHCLQNYFLRVPNTIQKQFCEPLRCSNMCSYLAFHALK